MENAIKQGSFVAISDFHSNRWPLDEKIPKYLNEYDVIYILGDATDRGKDDYGNNLEGRGGVQLLLDIMDLCKRNSNRVIYIPGNHDEFLYYYAAHRDTELGSFMSENLLFNSGYHTKLDIDNLKLNNPLRLRELINWLGSLPVQRVHVYDGKRYCLAHAFFNEKIFLQNREYSLEDMFQDNIRLGYDAYSKHEQILWFRKKGSSMNYDMSDVPYNSTMVIGHTPEQYRYGQNLDLQNMRGQITQVKCVDGGITYSSNEDEMLKYVGGDSEAIHTVRGFSSLDDTPEMFDGELMVDEVDTFVRAMVATAEKMGMNQIRGFIVNWVFKDNSNWSLPITRDGNHRYKVEALGISKVKKFIKSFSNVNEENIHIITENFVDELTKIIDERKREKQAILSRTSPYSKSIFLKSNSITEEKNVEPRIDEEFENEKAKIMKARFSDEQKQRLLEELEEEYFGIDKHKIRR